MSVLNEWIKQTKFSSASQEAILNIMLTSSLLRNRLNALCSEYDISLQQFNILRILKGALPGGYPRCQISERMVEKAPDTTRLIDRLVKTGLVKREKSENDMRQSIAKITEKGISLLGELSQKIDSFGSDLEAKVSIEVCKNISYNCNKMLEKL